MSRREASGTRRSGRSSTLRAPPVPGPSRNACAMGRDTCAVALIRMVARWIAVRGLPHEVWRSCGVGQVLPLEHRPCGMPPSDCDELAKDAGPKSGGTSDAFACPALEPDVKLSLPSRVSRAERLDTRERTAE